MQARDDEASGVEPFCICRQERFKTQRSNREQPTASSWLAAGDAGNTLHGAGQSRDGVFKLGQEASQASRCRCCSLPNRVSDSVEPPGCWHYGWNDKDASAVRADFLSGIARDAVHSIVPRNPPLACDCSPSKLASAIKAYTGLTTAPDAELQLTRPRPAGGWPRFDRATPHDPV